MQSEPPFSPRAWFVTLLVPFPTHVAYPLFDHVLVALPPTRDPGPHCLHDELSALRACCLVSKSWVPRIRRHLLTISLRADLLSNRGCKLPHPLHARPPPFRFQSGHYCNFGSASLGSLLHPYRRSSSANHGALERPLLLFHSTTRTTSPTLKSLYLSNSLPPPHSQRFSTSLVRFLFSEVCCCGCQISCDGKADKWNDLPASQKFTGSLMLSGSNLDVTRRLLGFPGGLHFSKIRVFCPIGGGNFPTELVPKCSDTLKSLCVGSFWSALSTGFTADKSLIASRRHTHDSAAAFT